MLDFICFRSKVKFFRFFKFYIENIMSEFFFKIFLDENYCHLPNYEIKIIFSKLNKKHRFLDGFSRLILSVF